MKKILFSIVALTSLVLSAQTTILADNFDSYDFLGTIVGSTSTIWDTWSENGAGTTEDAVLDNVTFNSPDFSIFIEGDEPGGFDFNDLILKFPNGET